MLEEHGRTSSRHAGICVFSGRGCLSQSALHPHLNSPRHTRALCAAAGRWAGLPRWGPIADPREGGGWVPD